MYMPFSILGGDVLIRPTPLAFGIGIVLIFLTSITTYLGILKSHRNTWIWEYKIWEIANANQVNQLYSPANH